MSALARSIATVGGVGNLRPAPGTWGSLAALPLAWLLHQAGGFPLLMTGTILLFCLGWWATHEATRDSADHDPSEIVVDEVVGQWIALWPLSLPAWNMGVEITAMWPGWIAAFLFFRLFDITKPGPVGLADRRGDALGVMLDDLIAGALAAMLVLVTAVLWHVVIAP